MNFTKDYIDLCKNDKVQGLKKKLEVGDIMLPKYLDDFIFWITRITNDHIEYKNNSASGYGKLENFRSVNGKPNHIFIPTSDQLDQCIIEQLDDGSDYTFIYTNFSKEAGHYNAIVYEGGEVKEQVIGETNPLIAKIKLLISLLEG